MSAELQSVENFRNTTQFESYVNTLIKSLRESDSSAISNRDVRAKGNKSLTDAYVGMVG
ncbi:hypothetical protein MNO09_00340 (plasmid) [Bacillus sp. N5-665]|uniref:hypothetical protein n=1 Tax=Bacillus sp. N5-665 TaxID=2925318 RepID=UPI0003307662|nr:hypothetical protein [Bacillus sp. N5-665]EOP02055.1 hypothetical protein ICS_05689 [Bacillus cereus BAG2O-3]UNK30993.1 hypothetical protein MNO09_00340 [Bacillus sp. N5-665]